MHKYRFVLSGGQMLHQIWAVNQAVVADRKPNLASHLSLQPVVPLLEFTSTSGRPPRCVEAPHLLLCLILYFHLRMFLFLIGSDGIRQPLSRAVSLIDAPWQSCSRGCCSFSTNRAGFACPAPKPFWMFVAMCTIGNRAAGPGVASLYQNLCGRVCG